MRIAALIVLAAASMLTTARAQAQRDDPASRPVPNGSRVRLRLSREESRISGRDVVAGTLVGSDGQHAIVARPGAVNPDTVATFTIDEFEVYDGHRGRLRMVLGGAAAGAGASLILLVADKASHDNRCKGVNPDCRHFITPIAYAAPVAVGALFGATFSSTRWRSVPRDIVSVAAGADRGWSVASTLHFR